MSSWAQILVVAHRTAATPKLLEHVRSRAQHGRCSFVIDLAMPLLEEAADAPVEAVVGDPDSCVATRVTLESSPFDEVIVPTLPRRVSHWLKLDLPDRIERLDVPVTVVTTSQSDRAWRP